MGLQTTLVGGVPKIGDAPEEQTLRRSLHQFDKGELTSDALEKIKDEITKDILSRQEQAGIDILTDGLIRWDDAVTYLARKIMGFEISGLTRYFDTNTFYRQPIVASRLETSDTLVTRDYQFAARSTSRPVKAVLTGPFTIAKLSRNQFYGQERQLIYDLAHILHREVQSLQAAGCLYVQFDEPALLSHKEEWKVFAQAYEMVTAGLTNIEKTIFFNFGNVDGVYPKILDLPVERIGLELTAGHKNWDVIRKSKCTKKLMAGVINTRNTKMESESDVAALVQELGEVASIEDAWLTHNFSLEFLPRSNAKQKVELLVKSAKSFKGASVS